MSQYNNKYRIETARLKGYDYSQAGSYFITICVKNMESVFGEITNGLMKLSKIGELAKRFWDEIPDHFSNANVDLYVVMPNHVHGILSLNGDNVVETLHATSLPTGTSLSNPISRFMQSISPKQKSVPTIIRSYKSVVTKSVHDLEFDFAWQPRFHEHIIRNNDEYNRISQYIVDNPIKWENDRLNSQDGNIVRENIAGYNYEEWMV